MKSKLFASTLFIALTLGMVAGCSNIQPSSSSTSEPDPSTSVPDPSTSSSITKLETTITIAESELVKEYDGQLASVNPSVDSGASHTLSWFIGDMLLEAAPKDAGSYNLKVSVSETETHKSASKDFVYLIEKRVLDLVWTPDHEDLAGQGIAYIYNHAHTVEASATNIVDGDVVNIHTTLHGDNMFHTEDGFYYTADSIDNDNYVLPENAKSKTYNICNDPFFNAISLRPVTYQAEYFDHVMESERVVISGAGTITFCFEIDYDCASGETPFIVLFEDGDSDYLPVDFAQGMKLYKANRVDYIDLPFGDAEYTAYFDIDKSDYTTAGTYYFDYDYDIPANLGSKDVCAALYWYRERSETTITWLPSSDEPMNYTYLDEPGVHVEMDVDYEVNGSTGNVQVYYYQENSDGSWNTSSRLTPANTLIPVGTYGVQVYVESDLYYDEAYSTIRTLVINKAEPTYNFSWLPSTEDLTIPYTGYPFVPEKGVHYTADEGVYISFMYKTHLGGDSYSSASGLAPTNAGQYRVLAGVSSDENHKAFNSTWLDFTILAPKTAHTFTWVMSNGSDIPYNGKGYLPTYGVDYSCEVAEELVSITFEQKLLSEWSPFAKGFKPSSVGSYRMRAFIEEDATHTKMLSDWIEFDIVKADITTLPIYTSLNLDGDTFYGGVSELTEDALLTLPSKLELAVFETQYNVTAQKYVSNRTDTSTHYTYWNVLGGPCYYVIHFPETSNTLSATILLPFTVVINA